MPHFKSMPANANPRAVYTAHPDIYRPWSEMSEAMMNGPSPLTEGEREMMFAFAAGAAGCTYVLVAHAEVAYARGIERGLIELMLTDFDNAPLSPRLRPLLAFVRKLAMSPADIAQADADAVFDAGWSERALHDAIAVTARAAFMQRLVQGHGFTPSSPEQAKKHAQERVRHGYVNLFPEFRKGK